MSLRQSTSTNPYADQYIDQMATNFINELKKIEVYDSKQSRQMYDKLVDNYDKEFIDQYMHSQGNCQTQQNLHQFSNSHLMDTCMPGPKPVCIPDGRFTKNVSN